MIVLIPEIAEFRLIFAMQPDLPFDARDRHE